MESTIELRRARPSDVAAIVSLVNGFAADERMLPRTPASVELALDDFIVAVGGGARQRVIACGALKEYSPSLAEVASLAVAPEAHGRGVGRAVVERLEELARQRSIHELFALTLTPGFFDGLGYRATDRARYPEKVARDCAGCPRRVGCQESCVARVLVGGELSAAA